jgi:hypothetical protein
MKSPSSSVMINWMKKVACSLMAKGRASGRTMMRGMRKIGCSLRLKEEPEEQRGDKGYEEGCLLPHS